jgi:excisionase family DNA binding protein
MNSQVSLPTTYTPDQVAQILQLSSNTVYDLINRGEIVAKRVGKVFRIPASSLSFIFTGLDSDLLEAEKADVENLVKIQKILSDARKIL